MIINLYFVIIFGIYVFEGVCGQGSIDDPCVLGSPTGSLGVCKLLTECQQVRHKVGDLETCGFQETQPIVCCRVNEGKRKPGAISKIKCQKYSSYASENSTGNECGHKIVKRVVGGETASRKEFAHMAAIGFEFKPDEITWGCGGSIISEQYILTAALCLMSPNESQPKYVQVGVSALNDTNHQQRFKIAQVIPFPDYKRFSGYHDIGLIKLDGKISFNSYARPACLYTEAEIGVEKAVATGWGYTERSLGVTSNDLQKVTLNFVDHEICNMTYSKMSDSLVKNGIVDEIQICAGSGGEAKNTCQGDAGGPLQIYHEGDDILCMYDIVGITSFGKGCTGEPGVYTRVSHFVKWIEDTIWPEST